MTIQITTQISAGMPVAAAMLAASDPWFDDAETTKRSFKLKNALSRHCTARNAKAKLTHFTLPYLAMASRPAVSTAPENTVNMTLPNVTFSSKFQNGARK